jgi:hypothetical protein
VSTKQSGGLKGATMIVHKVRSSTPVDEIMEWELEEHSDCIKLIARFRGLQQIVLEIRQNHAYKVKVATDSPHRTTELFRTGTIAISKMEG